MKKPTRYEIRTHFLRESVMDAIRRRRKARRDYMRATEELRLLAYRVGFREGVADAVRRAIEIQAEMEGAADDCL